MKYLFFSFLIAIAIAGHVHAETLTPVEVLLKQGMQVKMGELTGAGSKLSIKNLEGLILPEGVLLKSECSAIVIKNSTDPKISDIVKIKIQDQEILATEFVGIVFK
jgi:hypothetical protein